MKKRINHKDEFTRIINYLNKITEKNFRHSIKATERLINARLNEGYTLEDFAKVITVKTSQWLDNPEMKGYLRPETLFTAKHFGSYLAEYKEEKE